MSDRLTEREEDECAKMIIELAMLVPRGTDMRTHSVGRQLESYVRAVRETAIAKPCAGCAALRDALVKVRAHTGFRPDATLQLLVSLLASIGRIIDAALAQSQPDGTPTP
jgi:hypothetical protein